LAQLEKEMAKVVILLDQAQDECDCDSTTIDDKLVWLSAIFTAAKNCFFCYQKYLFFPSKDRKALADLDRYVVDFLSSLSLIVIMLIGYLHMNMLRK
jgi:divalent metal cation (Fe/Co/Zn/Cd) transporter